MVLGYVRVIQMQLNLAAVADTPGRLILGKLSGLRPRLSITIKPRCLFFDSKNNHVISPYISQYLFNLIGVS